MPDAMDLINKAEEMIPGDAQGNLMERAREELEERADDIPLIGKLLHHEGAEGTTNEAASEEEANEGEQEADDRDEERDGTEEADDDSQEDDNSVDSEESTEKSDDDSEEETESDSEEEK